MLTKKGWERLVPQKNNRYWYLEHRARYEFCKSFVSNKLVLDAGCGEGYGSSLLSEVAKIVEAIDINKNAIADAQAKYKRANLRFKVMDCRALTFKDSFFDVVCSFEVLEHIKQPQRYISEIHRVLKKGGLFILSTPNIERNPLVGTNPYHVKEYSLKEFKEVLGAFFGNRIEFYGQHWPLKAKQFYNSFLARGIYKIKRRFGIKRLIPAKIRAKAEKIIFGYSIQEGLTAKDFVISTKNLDDAEQFIAICTNIHHREHRDSKDTKKYKLIGTQISADTRRLKA